MVNLAELNLCFIAGTLGQGGAERQLFYLLKALRGAGASPSLLTLTQGEFWESRIRELGVPVIWVGQADSRLSRLKRIIRELRQIAAQSKTPMILQSQHFYTNIYAAAAARTLGLREIGAMRCDGFSEVQAHGRWPDRDRGADGRGQRAWACGRASGRAGAARQRGGRGAVRRLRGVRVRLQALGDEG